MNIYNALMSAADQIEKEPDTYNFMSGVTPECGTTGCMLGWIGFFLGLSKAINADVATALGLQKTGVFYERVTLLAGNSNHVCSAKAAAKGLRLYAVKYHAPAKPIVVPDWQTIASVRTVAEGLRSQEVEA